jgi:hypothetical protein
MTIWAHIVAWGSKAGAKLAGIGAVIISLLYVHNSAKNKAARQAVKDEQQRIEQETTKKKDKIKAQAHEIDEDIADSDADNLRNRMRSQATD